jgi:S1-C subfamily serine protease
MRLHLRITRTGEQPNDREFLIDALKIGRAPSSDLSIPDDRSQTVSWQHARIDTNSDGAWLHDLRSTNGTYINGRKVEQPERLRRGDVIRLGQAGPMLEILDLDAFQAHTSPAYTPNAAPPPLPAPNMRRSEPPSPAPVPEREPERERFTPARSKPVRSAANVKVAAPMSHTRAMLVGMQKKQRVWVSVAVVCLLIAGVAITLMFWKHEKDIDKLEEQVSRINKMLDLDTDSDTVDENEGSIGNATQDGYAQVAQLDKKVKNTNGKDAEVLYQRAVLSTAWVITNRGEGTGTVIEHQGKKLIVTAYHVVDQVKQPGVIFPKFMNGKILANRTHYVHNGVTGGKDTVPCTIWACDAKLDLAILEPTGLPNYIPALKVAGDSPDTASKVHTIGGSPSGTNGLWSYTQSEVRQVAPGELKYSNGQQIKATLVETANEVTFGDSGGPLFNNKTELLGVTSGGTDNKAAIARFIDCGHVRELLAQPRKNHLYHPPPVVHADPVPPPMVTPPVIPPPKKTPPILFPPKKTNPPVVTPTPSPSAPRGHVYVLFVIDDQAKNIGESCTVDSRTMRGLLENGLPRSAYTLEVLQGSRANVRSIQGYYDNLRGRVTPNDTLMFYYSGHGACDQRSGAHYLTLHSRENLHRGKVLDRMRSVGGKLHVMLTDCCSALCSGLDATSSPFGRGDYLVPLLLQQRGVVDWQAASLSECGWSNTNIGGFFTYHFKQALTGSTHKSWETLFSDVNRRTVDHSRIVLAKNEAAKKRGQKQQTPYRFPGPGARSD